QAARAVQRATSTAATQIAALSGMAGIDPMAEEFAQGAKQEGGYDAGSQSLLDAGVTMSQAVAGLEGHVLAIAAGYRAIEIAGAEPGASNPYASMTPTSIPGTCFSAGTALG